MRLCGELVNGSDVYLPRVAIDFGSLGGRRGEGGALWLDEVLTVLQNEVFEYTTAVNDSEFVFYLGRLVSVMCCSSQTVSSNLVLVVLCISLSLSLSPPLSPSLSPSLSLSLPLSLSLSLTHRKTTSPSMFLSPPTATSIP